MTDTHVPAVPAGYIMDAKRRLVPEELVRPLDRLIDDTVRKIAGYADQLSAQISRFRGHTFDDVNTLLALAAEQYEARLGGAKGNVTLTSYDGCVKVTVQVADHITFGPELQIAKQLVDECISTWSEGARSEIRAVVDSAFDTSKEGQVNREALLRLRRLDIQDETWKRAMAALTDSIRVIGSREYVRVYRRPSPTAGWQPISIDLASA